MIIVVIDSDPDQNVGAIFLSAVPMLISVVTKPIALGPE
jgi:hypothetical protein